MNIAQAKQLHSGDTLRRPSNNSHDVNGFRRYEVIWASSSEISIVDEYGYTGLLSFKHDKAYLKSLEPVKIQN